jgi:uncharacterized membrane protein
MAAEQAMRSPEEEEPRAQEHGGAGATETISAEIKQAIRDAALEVLGPAARQATMSATKFAVGKAPGLVTKHVLKGGNAGDLAEQMRARGIDALSQMGGMGGVAGKLLAKLGGAARGSAPRGWGHGRRMPVQQHIYVSVPVTDAYNGWTEYKQWPRFMHRANQVHAEMHDGEAHVKVTEKMWGFTRPFTAEIVTQRPDQQIRWSSTEGPKHAGVINFHELGPRLTLIELNLDHWPSGPVEKVARGARFVKRAVRADFHRFQGWIEMKSDDELDALEGWRGTIEDGHVVTSHEDALDEEVRPLRDEEEPEAGEEEEPEAMEEAEEEEPEPMEEAEEEEPEAMEEAEEEEPEPAEQEPRGARPARAHQERVRTGSRTRR